MEDLYVYKVSGVDGDSFVRFKLGNKLYDMSTEIAEKYGLAVNMICDCVEQYKHHGVLVTNMELKMHTFAIPISNDENKCKELVDLFFSN